MSMTLHLTMRKGKKPLFGEDYLWSLMMDCHELGKTFTIRHLRDMSSAREQTIRKFVQRLHRAGFVQETASSPIKSYSVSKPQAEAPRVRADGSVIESSGAAQCMWNGMRTAFRQGFHATDLVGFASTDEVKITFQAARLYIRHLAEAGYLIKLERGPVETALWRLDPSMNSGPKAPLILKTKMIFDQNKGDIVGAAEAEEVRS
jgi:hypothetical protein